jgi:hypothetical protein
MGRGGGSARVRKIISVAKKIKGWLHSFCVLINVTGFHMAIFWFKFLCLVSSYYFLKILFSPIAFNNFKKLLSSFLLPCCLFWIKFHWFFENRTLQSLVSCILFVFVNESKVPKQWVVRVVGVVIVVAIKIKFWSYCTHNFFFKLSPAWNDWTFVIGTIIF